MEPVEFDVLVGKHVNVHGMVHRVHTSNKIDGYLECMDWFTIDPGAGGTRLHREMFEMKGGTLTQDGLTCMTCVARSMRVSDGQP